MSEALPPGVSIREATREDLPRLIELLAQLHPEGSVETMGQPLASSYEQAFRDVDSDPRQRLLVLEVEGHVVGTLSVVIVPNVGHQGHPYALIENVVVDEQERSSGYGELMMKAAIETARLAGCYKVSLLSNKRRADAHRFYERLGFEPKHEGFRLDL